MLFTMKCAIVTTVLGFASVAMCAPVTYIVRQTSLEQITDNFLFSMSLDEFITYRNAQIGPAELDWSSNGCTSTPDHPFGFAFTESCQRHDFGYRNYRKQHRFTLANKKSIDSNFKQDMYNRCARESYMTRWLCRATAMMYYEGVRSFGYRPTDA